MHFKKLNKSLKSFFAVIISVFMFGVVNVHAQVNGNDYAIVLSASTASEDESGVQKIKIEIKSGKNANSNFDTTFKSPSKNIKRDLQKGDVVLVQFIKSPTDQKIQSVEIVDIYRLPNIFWLPIIFILIILVTVIVKYRRKVYIFIMTVTALSLSILIEVFLKYDPLYTIIPIFAVAFFLLLFFIYKKFSIALVGFLVPLILGVIGFLLAFITLQLGNIQLSYLSVLGTFYNIDNVNYTEAFYSATLISALVGGVYIAYQQILESIKIKITDIEVSKRELTLRSFKHMMRNFDTILFPVVGFLFAILFSVFLFLQRSIGLEAALNNDYWVSLSILCSISLVIWVITVPICALICGMILGRLEQHKIVTDKTISILD